MEQALLYVTLWPVFSQSASGPSGSRLDVQMILVMLSVFLTCYLLRTDRTPARRALGALIGIAAGVAALVVGIVPIALVSLALYPLGLVSPWVVSLVAVPVMVLGLAFTSRASAPTRMTVLMVVLGAAAVVALTAFIAPSLGLAPVVVLDSFAAFQLRFAFASNPIFAMVFGAGAGLGCAWPLKRGARKATVNV